MARVPTEHDNRKVRSFLRKYTERGLHGQHPLIEDIIGIAIEETRPRTLSRATLMHILLECPVISTPAAATATDSQYAYSTLAAHAALARLVSREIADYLQRHERST